MPAPLVADRSAPRDRVLKARRMTAARLILQAASGQSAGKTAPNPERRTPGEGSPIARVTCLYRDRSTAFAPSVRSLITDGNTKRRLRGGVPRYTSLMDKFGQFFEQFKVQGQDLADKVRELIHEGNVRRIIIKDDQGLTYMEIP